MNKARFSQRRGAATEAVTGLRLRFLGFGLICRINTPTKAIRGKRIFSGTCEGDWRAVGPGGISVLIECKYRPERLVFSDLEAHQWSRLDEHLKLGGLSLLAWQCRTGLFVLPWNILRAQGFAKGEGIGAEWAERHQLQRMII